MDARVGSGEEEDEIMATKSYIDTNIWLARGVVFALIITAVIQVGISWGELMKIVHSKPMDKEEKNNFEHDAAPGEVEGVFGRFDTAELVKAYLSNRDTRPASIPKGCLKYVVQFFFFLNKYFPQLNPKPEWLTPDDLNYYANKFNKTGFSGGLNFYRCIDLNWELSAPWREAQIQVPVKFLVGNQDLAYHMPGIQDYIHNGGFKKDIPGLQEVVVIPGAAHSIHQEQADVCSAHIHDFISKF
ncbi:hypothetical protein ACH5RR_020009 [Cinchona calisaya]|uniref:Epoxide hydrolase n=1 Tax=Cinchona calisaya TaxID=153742 RepID=A0ABD2ZGI1_9GENT